MYKNIQANRPLFMVTISLFAILIGTVSVIRVQAAGNGIDGWATSTSPVAGENLIFPNNTTDILCLGGTSTSTCPFYFDPNTDTSKLSGTLSAVIIPLQDTAANLASVVPASGQMVYETDTKYAKIGDGTTAVGSLNPTGAWSSNVNGFYITRHIGIGSAPYPASGPMLYVNGSSIFSATTSIGQDTGGSGYIAPGPLFTVIPNYSYIKVSAEIDDIDGEFGALFAADNRNCILNQAISTPCNTSGVFGYNVDGSGNAVEANAPGGGYGLQAFGATGAIDVFASSTDGTGFNFYGVGAPNYMQKTLSIGTTTTHSSVSATMAGGDVYVTNPSAATGVILQASDASCHRIVVSNSNVISATTVACPN